MNPIHSVVPVGWRESVAGEEITIHNNKREPISTEERAKIKGKFPYYGPTGILAYVNKYNFDGEFALIGEDGDHFLKFSDRDMTIMVNGKFVVNNHAHVVGDGPSCSAKWFHVYFQKRALTPFLTRQGVGRYKLTKAALENLPILVPPPKEQEKIIHIVERWDIAIVTLSHLIEKRRILRQGLMQQLLTGKLRFPGFGKPWQKVEIGAVLNEVDRPIEMKDGELYRLASVSRNWEGLFEREALHGRDIKTKNLREIKAGDFLISHIQAAYGALALVPQAFDGFKVSNMYSCLRPIDPAKFDLRFFAYLAQQPRMTYLCRTSSNGFFAERLRLNFMPDVFLQQTIDVPPSIEEQRLIINALELADHELALLEKLLAAYRGQKKGLMQQLLTGKRRVKVQAA